MHTIAKSDRYFFLSFLWHLNKLDQKSFVFLYATFSFSQHKVYKCQEILLHTVLPHQMTFLYHWLNTGRYKVRVTRLQFFAIFIISLYCTLLQDFPEFHNTSSFITLVTCQVILRSDVRCVCVSLVGRWGEMRNEVKFYDLNFFFPFSTFHDFFCGLLSQHIYDTLKTEYEPAAFFTNTCLPSLFLLIGCYRPQRYTMNVSIYTI